MKRIQTTPACECCGSEATREVGLGSGVYQCHECQKYFEDTAPESTVLSRPRRRKEYEPYDDDE